jgi:hypothetical protein
LLLSGCPTEADSSEEKVSYEETALGAAIVAAETDLNQTYWSSVGGNDVFEKAEWVSTVQYNAFKRAIEEAREVAYTLARAVAPTLAEEPALAALTTAHDAFNKQKASGKAKSTSAGDLATAVTEPKIVTGNVTLTSDLTMVAAGSGAPPAVLTVAPGAKLTTVAGKNVNIPLNTELIVKEGGTFEIVAGTTATSGLGGKITIESGATSIDKPGGGSLFAPGSTGAYVFKAGAIAMLGDSVFIGPASGNNKGQRLQLNTGELTLKVTGYELDGDATLVSHFGISTRMELKMTATSTLTIDGGNLHGFAGSTDFLDNIAGSNVGTGARIVLLDSSSSISVDDDSPIVTTKPVIEDLAGNDLWDTAVEISIDGTDAKAITGPAVLVKTASGWTKQ